MKEAFSIFSPGERLSQQKIGNISDDRSVIVGKSSVLFLYSGNNHYYQQYMSSELADNGRLWAELLASRHRRLSTNAQVISLMVPNKASCLSDLYPLPLDSVPTSMWQMLYKCLGTGHEFVFSEKLLEASTSAMRSATSPWRLVDSHWSEFGCLLTANELLERLGLSPIDCEVRRIELSNSFGDFSSKFGEGRLVELQSARLADSLPQPLRAYDSGKGEPYEGSMGRRVTWSNEEALVPLHLLIVGNSFAGIGDGPTHLTYWFSRVFKKTTFLHAAHMPADVLDFYRPDVILFQGVERFLISVPSDDLSAESIESIFNARVAR